MTARAAVFMDRDGVLNEVITRDGRPESPRHEKEFSLAPGAAPAVARLQAAGLPVLVVTNQPDLARGLLPQPQLELMMERLVADVGVDDTRVCPHDEEDDCACRKPRPGLLQDLAASWGVDLSRSFMVGDSWRDVDAGRAVGCRTVLLRTWYNGETAADAVVDSISAAADWILAELR